MRKLEELDETKAAQSRKNGSVNIRHLHKHSLSSRGLLIVPALLITRENLL